MKQEEKKKSQRLEHQENAGGRGQARLDGVQWLDAATRSIRFKPDRAAVRSELEAHLEDKRADLQRIFPDLSHQEAESRALAAMGDPEALGRELAKIHKPWLGYLWRLSQVLCICMILGVLWGNMSGTNPLDIWFQTNQSWLGAQPDDRKEELERIVFGSEIQSYSLPGQEAVEYRGYTFTVEEGTVWRPVAELPEDRMVPYEQAVLPTLRVEWSRPDQPMAANFSGELWAEDDRGNGYLSGQDYYHGEDDMPQWGEPQLLHCGVLARTPWSSTYEVVLPVLSRETTQVSLRYTYGGADLSIPVVLEGGL